MVCGVCVCVGGGGGGGGQNICFFVKNSSCVINSF